MTGTISFTVLVALTTGIVEVIKGIGVKLDKFAPVIGLVLGIALTYIANLTGTIEIVILNSLPLTAIAVGLAANGLFDQSKIVKK